MAQAWHPNVSPHQPPAEPGHPEASWQMHRRSYYDHYEHAKAAKQQESCAFVSLMSSRKVPFVLVSSSSTRGVTASRSLTTVQCRPLTSWRQILKVLFLQNPTCCDYCRAGRHQQVSTAQQLGSVPFRPGTPESGTSTSRSLPSCGSVNTFG